MTQTGVVAGGVLTDWVSLGVLASSVPRDVVDDAIAEAGKSAKRARGKLPPHVMVYFVMALALFAGDDYEEVAARLTETLRGWGCWEADWEVPTSGGITQVLAATLSAHRLAAFGVHVLAVLGGDDAWLAAGGQAVPLPG
jgi:Insertion element 4 transposase N-terminal